MQVLNSVHDISKTIVNKSAEESILQQKQFQEKIGPWFDRKQLSIENRKKQQREYIKRKD